MLFSGSLPGTASGCGGVWVAFVYSIIRGVWGVNPLHAAILRKSAGSFEHKIHYRTLTTAARGVVRWR